MSTVYSATNVTNGDRYIGVTIRSLSERRSQHKHVALVDKLDTAFYRAIREYGFDSFRFEILSRHETDDEARAEEAALISGLKPQYNMVPGGGGRRAGCGRNGRSIVCLNDGSIFESIASAARFCRASPGSVGAVCARRKPTIKGCVFRYEGDVGDENVDEIKLAARDAQLTALKRGPISNSLPVTCHSDNREFESVSAAARFYGIPKGNICRACSGRYKSAGGRRFSYTS